MSGFESARCVGAFAPTINTRSYTSGDRDSVFRLLSFLPNLYPRSFEWLERRLADVEKNRAFCTLAFFQTAIAGVLIDTPKGARTSKISTFYTSNRLCGRGVGSLLFWSSTNRWHAHGVDDVYITVASSRRESIAPFLYSKGFVESANLPERYGLGRDELVYTLHLN
jgi:hypothetical protein